MINVLKIVLCDYLCVRTVKPLTTTATQTVCNIWTHKPSKQIFGLCVFVFNLWRPFVLWIDWPLLDDIELTSTQSDAIAQAFTDYIWEKIQNENNQGVKK